LLQSFVHIMRVGSAESQCSDVPGPFGFRVFVLWASECGQFLYLRFAVFFCTFVCFCFSFKLNANKFAFFVPRPARHFYAHHPGSNCSKCGVVGEKVSFALGTRAFDLVYFHFISFRLVSFRFVWFGFPG